MAEYVKKVLIFDEIERGYSLNGKKISGVLKIEKIKDKSKAEIYVTNFNRKRAEAIECVLCINKSVYDTVSTSSKFNLDTGTVGQYDDVSCLLAAVNGDACVPFAFASNNDRISADDVKQHLAKKVEEAQTEYEQFVCATDNFYEKENSDAWDLGEIRKKSVQKFKPIEELGNVKVENGKDFFNSVKTILKKILESYPPCDELNDEMKNSFWVKVPFKQEKYFVVGLVESDGKPQYIVYGVPGRRNKKPADSSFVFFATRNSNEGYWMLYQDVKTGLCAEKVAINA